MMLAQQCWIRLNRALWHLVNNRRTYRRSNHGHSCHQHLCCFKEQCKTQLNVKVSEKDLKDILSHEITENSDTYRAKVDNDGILENLSTVNHLDVNIQISQCPIQLWRHSTETGWHKGSRKRKICFEFKGVAIILWIWWEWWSILSCDISQRKHRQVQTYLQFVDEEVKIRWTWSPSPWYAILWSNPSNSHKYNSTTAATRVTDLYNILEQYKDEKSIFMFLSDGGPDFNPSHLQSLTIYYGTM